MSAFLRPKKEDWREVSREVSSRSLRPRPYRGFRARTLLLATFIATSMASSAYAVVDLTELGVFKGQDYVDNVVQPGFFFEGCVEGSGILSGTMTVGAGSPLTLVQDGTEWCFEDDGIVDISTLDATYPSTGTVYTFILVPSDAGPNVTYTVSFTAAIPTAFPQTTTPAANDEILDDRDLPIDWTFAAACPACDGVFVGIENVSAGGSAFATIPPLAAGTTEVLVPSSSLTAGADYLVEISSFDGSVTLAQVQNSDTYIEVATYEIINEISLVSAVPRTLDLQAAELLKGLDREDGTILSPDGYFFEGCVVGTGITSVTLEAPSGPQVATPDGEEFCVDQSFGTIGALDAAFPSAGETYTFTVTQTGGATIEVPIIFDLDVPGGSLDFTNPADQAVVPANQDLDVMWNLVPETPACGSGGGAACGDGIFFFVVEVAGDQEVVTDISLPITATNRLVPSSALTDGLEYEIEIETVTGGPTAETEGDSDAYQEVTLYEDINLITITVPEPGAAVLGIFALMTTVGVARIRRR